jgi:molybdenum cofactor synthesis domain-containing protein
VVDGLRALGLLVGDPIIVADGEPVAKALAAAVADDVDLIVTTGGTGHTPTDLTPEMTRRVIDRESPGLAEAIRAYGVANGVAMSVLSRGIAGIAGTTLVVNLPGSVGGARDGVSALAPVLLHALDQVRGGDH